MTVYVQKAKNEQEFNQAVARFMQLAVDFC